MKTKHRHRSRAKQCDIFSTTKTKPFFGGSSLTSNPKTARPISTKDIMHVVLKSEKAKGPLCFTTRERLILNLIRNLAAKLGVQVNDAVVMSNHIHLSLRVYQRRAFKAYMRSLPGLIARLVLKAEKGRASALKNFFVGRPFSRIVALGYKSFKALREYFELNRLEKRGFTKEKSRYLGLLKTASQPR